MSTLTNEVEVPETFSLVDWAPSPQSPYRMSVEKYEAMVASGVFSKLDGFELINGYLLTKMTQYPPHAAACDGAQLALQASLPANWLVRSDRPVRIPTRSSEPEPDISLVRRIWRDYESRHPEPKDVALLVEVADSSLRDDRTVIAQIYVAGGIPVYWIVNLVDRQIEVYETSPPEGYHKREIFLETANVPLVIDGAQIGQIAVGAILPKPKEEQ